MGRENLVGVAFGEAELDSAADLWKTRSPVAIVGVAGGVEPSKGESEMGKARLFAVAACAAAVVGAGASAAVAGEVTGPPGSGNIKGVNPNASLCAYSGLNDFIQGQSDRQTQTPKDAAPGSAAFGWAPDPTDPTFILTCNKNGPVGA